MGPSTNPEDRPIRTLAAALSLTLLLPAAAVAQDDVEPAAWPTADELRRDLQGIGYRFAFDPSNMAAAAEWQAGLPAVWRLIEPVVVDDAMPADTVYEALTLRIVDIAGQPAQLLFGATSADRASGEMEAVTGVLMEVASRLPDGAGLDAAVWFMSNVWLGGLGEGASTLPCLVQEFDGGAMVVWRGGDGEGLESFFGTVTHFDGESPEVEQCRAVQAGAAGEATEASSATETAAPAGPVETVDYTVPPAAI